MSEEALYAPPTHLKATGSIGIIPERTFGVLVAAAVVMGPLAAFVGYRAWPWPGMVLFGWHAGRWPGIALFIVPIIFAIPFMLTIDPPPEYGIGRWLAYKFKKKVLLPQHHKSLKNVRVEKGVIYLERGCRAVFRLPTINLDLASTETIKRHRGQLGRLLDGISTHPFQIVVRSESMPMLSAVDRMRNDRNPFSRKLADWLQEHHKEQQAIDRKRYLVIPADDVQQLEDRVTVITRSLKQAGLSVVRMEDATELRELINRWWTWHPHETRLGPERVDRSVHAVQLDGEWARVFAMASVPSTIDTNWWRQLVDSDLPVDVSMTLYQRDLWAAKQSLNMRYNNLAASARSASRDIALAQITKLQIAFERHIRPWDCQILLVVRGATEEDMESNSRRLIQQCKDLSFKLKEIRWDHYEAMVSAQPLCLEPLPRRSMYLETGTLARTSPLAASTLQMRDGVPWGLAGSAPIMLTTAGIKTGKHFGWYGMTGSGKGFGVRCYLSRRHFADGLRIFVWDTDDVQHEYSGRWCKFMEGVSLRPKTLQELRDIELHPRWNVVVLDATRLDQNDWPQAFAIWTSKVQAMTLEFPRETAFVVDEATILAYAPDKTGAIALGQAVQTWRKRGVEVHVITQRVSDWFNTDIGKKIQGNLAVKWYGAQEDSELYDVAEKVHLSPEERDKVGGAGQGQGLLVAFGRRVWADLYEHCSPEEYDAYHTDPVEQVELSVA